VSAPGVMTPLGPLGPWSQATELGTLRIGRHRPGARAQALVQIDAADALATPRGEYGTGVIAHALTAVVSYGSGHQRRGISNLGIQPRLDRSVQCRLRALSDNP